MPKSNNRPVQVYHCAISFADKTPPTAEEIIMRKACFDLLSTPEQQNFPWQIDLADGALKEDFICDCCGGCIYYCPIWTPTDIKNVGFYCGIDITIDFWMRESTCDQIADEVAKEDEQLTAVIAG